MSEVYMKEQIKLEVLIQFLMLNLNCKQKLIATYTGLNESTISANLDKFLSELVTKKSGRKIYSLFLVVDHLVKKGLSNIVIRESINEAVFQDLDGNFDSVITAIVNDKYLEPSVLVSIAESGYGRYQKKINNRNSLRDDVAMVFRNSEAN